MLLGSSCISLWRDAVWAFFFWERESLIRWNFKRNVWEFVLDRQQGWEELFTTLGIKHYVQEWNEMNEITKKLLQSEMDKTLDVHTYILSPISKQHHNTGAKSCKKTKHVFPPNWHNTYLLYSIWYLLKYLLWTFLDHFWGYLFPWNLMKVKDFLIPL